MTVYSGEWYMTALFLTFGSEMNTNKLPKTIVMPMLKVKLITS